MTDSIRLDAASLWSKWGFQDGDIVMNECPDDIAYSGDDPLIDAVRKYLLPLLPGVEVEDDFGHNPVRAKGWSTDWQGNCPDEYRDIYVDVTFDQLRELTASRSNAN